MLKLFAAIQATGIAALVWFILSHADKVLVLP